MRTQGCGNIENKAQAAPPALLQQWLLQLPGTTLQELLHPKTWDIDRASQQHRRAGTDPITGIHRYSEKKTILRDSDPHLWWEMNEPTLPSLRKMGRKQLGAIATSVVAERILKGHLGKKFNKCGECKHVTVTQQKPHLKGSVLGGPIIVYTLFALLTLFSQIFIFLLHCCWFYFALVTFFLNNCV